MIYILDFHSLFPKVRHLAKVKVTWSIIFIFAEKRDRELDKCVEFSKVVKVNVLGKHSGLSVQFSHSVVSDFLQLHGLQHFRLPCPSPFLRACANSCPLSQWCQPTISSSVTCSPPTFYPSRHQGLFRWVGSSHQVAKVMELQLQNQSFQWVFRVDFL